MNIGSFSRILLVLSILTFFSLANSYAQAIPESFTYQGRLFDSDNVPLSGSLTLTVKVLSPLESCLLFEEAHAITTEDGTFSINVGQGTRTGRDPGGLLLSQVFSNEPQLLVPASATCVLNSGYIPTSGDKRKIKVTVSGESGTTELDSQAINSVPQALVAQTLQGLTTTDLLRVWPDTASRPATPPTNTFGVNIATGDMEEWDGTTWNVIS
jgi:hypothetical protein